MSPFSESLVKALQQKVDVHDLFLLDSPNLSPCLKGRPGPSSSGSVCLNSRGFGFESQVNHLEHQKKPSLVPLAQRQDASLDSI
jgi:hypothetical protein